MAYNFFAVDDEPLQLALLDHAIKMSYEDAEVRTFKNPFAVLEAAKTACPDACFLDINMPGMTGIELAEKLKEMHPRINLIFVTGYSEYMSDALRIFASGYVLKPVNAKSIREQVENLRFASETKSVIEGGFSPAIGKEKGSSFSNSVALSAPNKVMDDILPNGYAGDGTTNSHGKHVILSTFGLFSATIDGVPLSFSRKKSKELLAYLVDRKGAVVSRREIAAVLFEDKDYSRNVQKELSHFVAALEHDLAKLEAEDIFLREHDGYRVDRTKFSCDLYDFMSGKRPDLYKGEYMEQFSWGELFKGLMDR